MKKIWWIVIGLLILAGSGLLPPPPGEPPGEPPAPAPKMFYLSKGHPYGFTGDIYKIAGNTIWLLPQGLEWKDIEYFGERVLLKIVITEKTELFRINQRGQKETLSPGNLSADQRITTAVIWQWEGKEAQKIQIMEKP